MEWQERKIAPGCEGNLPIGDVSNMVVSRKTVPRPVPIAVQTRLKSSNSGRMAKIKVVFGQGTRIQRKGVVDPLWRWNVLLLAGNVISLKWKLKSFKKQVAQWRLFLEKIDYTRRYTFKRSAKCLRIIVHNICVSRRFLIKVRNVMNYTINHFLFFLIALAPFLFSSSSISFKVGNCVNWSIASPPTENAFAAHNTGDWPLSFALNVASTARIVLIKYIVPRPVHYWRDEDTK